MYSAWFLPALALAYVAVLFAVAYRGDRGGSGARVERFQPLVYALSIGVYCSSWTFYGAVGSAAAGGLSYLPIYLGPILVFVFGGSVLRRMISISQARNITSIADLIAHRYGNSRIVAIAITVLAVAGGIPYIALQLKAVDMSLNVLSGTTAGPLPAAVAAAGLAVFAILFGTRELDATEHHRGLMWAIALESLVKLIAFAAVSLFALFGLLGGFSGMRAAIDASPQLVAGFSLLALPDAFVTSTLLATAAIVCLPRQFHVMVVEYRDERDLATARWLFPLYLAAFCLLVIPVTVAGVALLDPTVAPDTFVLALPAAAGNEVLAALAFIGGFSAATGMVIVATVALATMVSNDMVLPALLRLRGGAGEDAAPILLRARRLVIVAITTLAWLYFLAVESTQALAAIGLLAFSAVAQFAPPLILGLYWPRASRAGAISGIAVGGLLWFFTLLLPGLLPDASPLLRAGLFGVGWLRPEALFGLSGLDPLTHGVLWSVGLNTLVLAAVSLISKTASQRGIPRTAEEDPSGPDIPVHAPASLGDLHDLAARFIGRANASLAFENQRASAGWPEDPEAPATAGIVQFTERLLAGSIGAASARSIMASALRSRGLKDADAARLLDTTYRVARFNRQLLDATLNSIPQGVSVVDEELRLVGWNQAYVDLFEYPAGMVHVGRSIADLIRFNAKRGMLGTTATDAEIEKRLAHMRAGRSHRFERRWPDGRHIDMHGTPLPGVGYVTTFTDVTAYKRAESALKEVNETLEQRVIQRTHELSEAVDALESAKGEAEAANQAKSRFLAAASHDLLQPLNAARLFASVLSQHAERMEDEHAALVKRVDASLTAAEELLSALLDISKLDRGVLKPELERFHISDVLERIRSQFEPLVRESGLSFRLHRSDASVCSDRQMLRRIVQNFVANAFRYTPEGGILIGTRRRGDR
ncbi:MAG: PAS-domain containing protein, partial [Xanthomonadales bacterium]|nr:PAS-domain containing protein [Xanthomonadales bacterium]